MTISCSSEGNKSQDELIEEAYPYVTNTGTSIGIEDFKDKGFKSLRQYKSVAELFLGKMVKRTEGGVVGLLASHIPVVTIHLSTVTL